jgi:RNA polymerase sigma-70 factor (ECF subfamily)
MPGTNAAEATATEGPARDDRLRALIEAAARGDMKAFSLLYDETAPWLLARVRRIVGEAFAEDVLAEVYLQAWRGLGEFDPLRGNAMVWLATIARSRALDRLRHERARSGAQPPVPWDDAQGDLPSEAPGPEQQLAHRQAWRQLEGAMARLLSARERMVLGLAYFRDHSHSEIALITQLPVGTVKTLLTRSQQKLRAALCPPKAPRPLLPVAVAPVVTAPAVPSPAVKAALATMPAMTMPAATAPIMATASAGNPPQLKQAQSMSPRATIISGRVYKANTASSTAVAAQ